jgi:hypothetical protein
MSNLFDTLSREAFRAGVNPRTDESRKWFRQRAKELRGIDRKDLMQELPAGGSVVGSMIMFFYDPKTKDTLPYYDTFPLVVVVGPAPGGFYGLNLHYLPPMLRAKMLDGLMDIASSKKSPNAKFDISYKTLKGISKLRYYKPCFKHYLGGYLKSGISMVPAPEWEIATFLPVAQFKKIPNPLEAYADSRAMIL